MRQRRSTDWGTDVDIAHARGVHGFRAVPVRPGGPRSKRQAVNVSAMPDIADRLAGANLPAAPPNIGADDRQFLTSLWVAWGNRPRTANENRQVIDALDGMFRASDAKNAHVDPAAYVAALQSLDTGHRPNWELRMQTGAAVTTWVAGGCTSGDDYLLCEPWKGTVVWRIYVNATADHAPSVFGALCTGIVGGNIPAFCKLGSFDIVRSGRDAVVAYAGSVAARDAIVGLLRAHVQNNAGHVVDEVVRFTAPRARGVSVAGDPTAMMDEWSDAASAWITEQTYGSDVTTWQTEQGRSIGGDQAYFMSFSQLVAAVIARAWRVTPANGNVLTTTALAFHDIGLDLATGALAVPTVFGAAWLQDRFFPET